MKINENYNKINDVIEKYVTANMSKLEIGSNTKKKFGR